MNAPTLAVRRAPIWLAASLVATPCAGLALLAATKDAGGAASVPLALGVAALSLAALLRPIEPAPGEKLSLAAAIAFFGILVLPATQALAAITAAELAARLLRRTSVVSALVNVSKAAGAAGAASAAAGALRLSPAVPPDLQEVLVAGALYVLVALAPVAAMIGWTQGTSAVRGFLAREWLPTATLVAIGALGAVVWSAMPLLMVLLALPLAMVEIAARAAARARESRDAAERALEVQRAFVADAAHELRNPLAAIRGNLAFVRPDGLDEDDAEALAAARRDVAGLASLVDRLLLLSGVDATIAAGEADVAAIARRVAPSIPRRPGVALELDLPERAAARLPVELCESVIRDLVGNAAAYTERGAIRVSVRATRDEVSLEVHDTGIGIEAGELSKVFDRFYRGAAARRLAQGSGLGLAIVRRVVEAYGGSIAMASGGGAGTTARVRMPAAEGANG